MDLVAVIPLPTMLDFLLGLAYVALVTLPALVTTFPPENAEEDAWSAPKRNHDVAARPFHPLNNGDQDHSIDG